MGSGVYVLKVFAVSLFLYSFAFTKSPTRIKACAVTNDQEEASVDGNVNQQNSMIINTIALL